MASGEISSKDEKKDADDWRVEEPEEAKYNFSDEKGVWQPKPEDILTLFEKLAGGGPLPLKWQCPGRRPPKSKEEVAEESTTKSADLEREEEKEEKPVAPEASAFDFDEFSSDPNTKLTPIRAPGGSGRTPRTKKRARMDNIMDSLRKQHLQSVAEREARRARGSQSGAPNSRLFGLNRSAASSPAPAVSAITTTSAVPVNITTSAPLGGSAGVTTIPSFSRLPENNVVCEPMSSTVPETGTVTSTATELNTKTSSNSGKPTVQTPAVTKRDEIVMLPAPSDAANIISAADTSKPALVPALPTSNTSASQAPKTSSEATGSNPQNASVSDDTLSSNLSQTTTCSSSAAPLASAKGMTPTATQLTCISVTAEKNVLTTLSMAALSSEPVSSSVVSSQMCPVTFSTEPTSITSAEPLQHTAFISSTDLKLTSVAGLAITSSTTKPVTTVVPPTITGSTSTSPLPPIPAASADLSETSVSPPSLPPPYSVPLSTDATNIVSSSISTSISTPAPVASDTVPVPVSEQISEAPLSETKHSVCKPSSALVGSATSNSETSLTEVKTANVSHAESTPKDSVESEIKSMSLKGKS
ncbi:hypothetical protein ElyMa_006226700 [Elysia marginata]|uniref:WW domain-containing protein n=1 Tax=Elysia marginata TaxID=1093978 RepID=A0AAV4H750_9GAST|nr:hypothetical protein ElyMa_006226700 [Elysia marginata]